MSTDSATIAFDSITDVQFRTWGQRISQALTTCGLVKTTDTGQIDWTTISRNAGTSAELISGYEMFRFSDDLQATRPVFIKVEYGHVAFTITGTNVNGSPVIYVTVGTATNGAGTLTGTIISTRTRFCGGGGNNVSGPTATPSQATASSPCRFAGDGSWIGVALGLTALAQPIWAISNNNSFLSYSSFPAFFMVERTRNSDGTSNGDGVVVLTSKWAQAGFGSSPTLTPTYQILSFTGGAATVGAQDGYWPISWPGSGFGNANFNGDIYFVPLVTATPKPQAQALCVLGTWKNDVPLLSPMTVTVLGAARTYISLAGIAGINNADNTRSQINATTPNGALMMRYE